MNKYRRWTREEDNELIRLYGYVTLKDLGTIFNRSPQKVCRRATRLGIRKTREVCNKNVSDALKAKYARGELTHIGSKNPRWNGGKKISGGYVYLWKPLESMADARGYVAEHRYVMSRKIGRPLVSGEDVHHIDHNPMNNHPNNLVLTNPSEHKRKYHIKEIMQNLSRTRSHRIHNENR